MSSVSNVATKNDLDQANKTIKDSIDQVNKNVDGVLSTLQDFMQHVDERFNAQDHRTNELDKKFSERFDRVDKRFDQLIGTMDGFVARLDNNETEQAASDYQFQKLLDWARMVSKKTGIPIKDL
ncbi:MAG: hypothetical protein QG628_91 [Patescibacteria group bacterium]|jgi:chromosome segregation ATPase|nr:hypothetical protein [Patescibacteria group bacterium]